MAKTKSISLMLAALLLISTTCGCKEGTKESEIAKQYAEAVYGETFGVTGSGVREVLDYNPNVVTVSLLTDNLKQSCSVMVDKTEQRVVSDNVVSAYLASDIDYFIADKLGLNDHEGFVITNCGAKVEYNRSISNSRREEDGYNPFEYTDGYWSVDIYIEEGWISDEQVYQTVMEYLNRLEGLKSVTYYKIGTGGVRQARTYINSGHIDKKGIKSYYCSEVYNSDNGMVDYSDYSNNLGKLQGK